MTRERNFKIYLNNPSMRAALFAPIDKTETEKIGHLAESAIFSQWQHASAFRNLRYARWRNEGEIDVVYLAGAALKPNWIGEIKWSDRISSAFGDETKAIATFLRKHPTITSSFITTKTITKKDGILEDKPFNITPTAAYCYTVGRNITSQLDMMSQIKALKDKKSAPAS